MKDCEHTMYGALVEKSVRDISWLLNSDNKHPAESELERSSDPFSRYIAGIMKEKRLMGNDVEYIFQLPPTFENLLLLTKIDESKF